jgi:hypothetical protein
MMTMTRLAFVIAVLTLAGCEAEMWIRPDNAYNDPEQREADMARCKLVAEAAGPGVHETENFYLWMEAAGWRLVHFSYLGH